MSYRTDSDFLPGDEDEEFEDEGKLGNKKPKKPGKRGPNPGKVLSAKQDEIKILAECGLQPKEISYFVNKGSQPKDMLSNKQVAGKIGRMRTQGQLKMKSAAKAGQSLRAEASDSMLTCQFAFIHSLGDWATLAATVARSRERQDFADSAQPEEEQIDIAAIETSYLTSFGRCVSLYPLALFISRVRTQATKTHFYILCEACVSRKWSVRVTEDDTMVELTVTLVPPDAEVFTALFQNHHLNFGFLSDENDVYTFLLSAERSLNRHEFSKAAFPDSKFPLWYGFVFTYELAPTAHDAANVDLSDFLINESRKRVAPELEGGPAPKKPAVVENSSFVSENNHQ